MSDILDDIVDEIEIKPNKSKVVLKWIVGVSLSLITLAYTTGNIISNNTNEQNEIKKGLEELKTATIKNQEDIVKIYVKLENLKDNDTEIKHMIDKLVNPIKIFGQNN